MLPSRSSFRTWGGRQLFTALLGLLAIFTCILTIRAEGESGDVSAPVAVLSLSSSTLLASSFSSSTLLPPPAAASSTAIPPTDNDDLSPISPASIWGLERHIWVRIVGGIFAILAWLLSFIHIRAHMRNNHDTQLRRYVVRILWMVPVYATVGWLGLLYRGYVVYLDVIRDFYESYVIWSFLQFCLVYLGGSIILNEQLSRRAQIQHTWPLNSWPLNACVSVWSMEHEFLFHTRLGVLQYVIIKLLLAIITFSLAAADEYNEGMWEWGSPYTWITVITNISQGYALYALFLFYHATKHDLERIRPLAKFLCVKLIVFATYWQSVVLSLLVLLGRFPSTPQSSSSSLSSGLQNFLICIEMCVASCGHMYAFPSREFWSVDGGDDGSRVGGVIDKVIDVMTPSDVFSEVKELSRMKNKYQQVSNEQDNWATEDNNDDTDSGGGGNGYTNSSTSKGSAAGSGGGGGKGRRKKRKGVGKGGSDEVGVEPIDEAGKSYGLEGIEERMQRLKLELMERNRATLEARRHMRADYSNSTAAAADRHDNEEKEDEEVIGHSTIELHDGAPVELHSGDGRDEDEEVDGGLGLVRVGGDEEQPNGTVSPNSWNESERGSNRSLIGMVRELDGEDEDAIDYKRNRPRNRDDGL